MNGEITNFNDVINMENFWSRRFAALLVDILILTLFMWIVSAVLFMLMAVLGIYSILNLWVFLGALIIIAYFTYMEGKTSSTFGKKLFKLKVKAFEGNMNFKKAFIRNISKILWLPLILDVLLGFLFGDSNDRYLDKVSGTFVVMDVEEPIKTGSDLNKH